MNNLDTAYKLGSAKAVEQLTSWMDQDGDEKAASAMERLAEKLGGRKKKKPKPAPKSRKGQRATRAPTAKGTRYKRLKSKLKRTKKAEAPAWAQQINKGYTRTPRPGATPAKAAPTPAPTPAPAPAPTPAPAPAAASISGGAMQNLGRKLNAPLKSQPVAPVGGYGGASQSVRNLKREVPNLVPK